MAIGLGHATVTGKSLAIEQCMCLSCVAALARSNAVVDRVELAIAKVKVSAPSARLE
jgi:hypothetical protein